MKSNSHEFTTDFGKRMEKYLELGLQESNTIYLNEISLKKKYSTLTKVCDFLIGPNILVECKAIELHPRAGVIRSPEILHREFEGSLIKSYEQLISTAHTIDSSKSWYALVVTYKDTYIGFGNDAWEEFLKKPITDYTQRNNLSLSVLPPQNLIFLEIEHWDHLIQAVKEKQGSILEIIEKSISLNRSENPSEKILLFDQALRTHYPIGSYDFSFLDDAHALISTPV